MTVGMVTLFVIVLRFSQQCGGKLRLTVDSLSRVIEDLKKLKVVLHVLNTRIIKKEKKPYSVSGVWSLKWNIKTLTVKNVIT